MAKIRTRFAPSPTGYLHIGGLRSALFAYLTAKSLGGEIILRIEDTDQKRKVDDAVEKLLVVLKKLGLDFDEGPGIGGDFGPYVQTERQAIYDKYAEELLRDGKAYRCFCTSERLAGMREEQAARKEPPRYDRRCRELSGEEVEKRLAAGERSVIRQKMPLDGEVVVKDELRGEIKFNAEELEDQVLVKSDGIPTYHFALVVDDHLMKISHVLRGDEWLPSYPKHVLLYKAFGWDLPKFVHMPLILNKGGGKLSKRQGDVSVEEFLNKGFLPKALINFCALLGWHPKGDEELMDMDRLISEFKLEDMGISPAVFDTDKLTYMNGLYIREMPLDELTRYCLPYLKGNIEKAEGERKHSDEFIKAVVGLEQERLKTLSEIAELSEFMFVSQPEYEKEILAWKKMELKDAISNIKKIIELLEAIPESNWTNDSVEDAVMSYITAKELKVGEYLWPMRVALSGKKASPGPFDIAEALGKADSLSRLEFASRQ